MTVRASTVGFNFATVGRLGDRIKDPVFQLFMLGALVALDFIVSVIIVDFHKHPPLGDIFFVRGKKSPGKSRAISSLIEV
jgi:hypothetical protein